MTLADIEKEAILRTIIHERSVYKAAKELRVGRATIYRRLRSYGIVRIGQIPAALAQMSQNGKNR